MNIYFYDLIRSGVRIFKLNTIPIFISCLDGIHGKPVVTDDAILELAPPGGDFTKVNQ